MKEIIRKPELVIGLVLLTVGWSSVVNAEDDRVYEELAGVQIGSVFFSPAQRLQLDRKRQGRSDARIRSGNRRSRKSRPKDAAGYIVKGTGEVQVYVNGDFVRTPERKAIVFPGDIKITKTAAPETPITTGEEQKLPLDRSDDEEK